MLPETKYAQSSDVSIADQVVGRGPLDLLTVPAFISHLEQAWENPAYSRFLQRLASFSRLIQFDTRGTGLSDRITEIPTLEQGMDDVRIVMDTTGCERTAPSIPISGHGRQKVLAESRPTSSRVSPISFSAESFRNRTSGRRKHRRRCAQSCQAERRANPRRSSTSDSTPMRRAAAGAPRPPPQGARGQGRRDTGSDRAMPRGHGRVHSGSPERFAGFPERLPRSHADIP